MYQKQFFQLILILVILQFSNSSIFAKTVIDCEYLAAVAEEKKIFQQACYQVFQMWKLEE